MVGFPTVDEAVAEFSRYRNNGYLYKQPADFPWSHPVLYWVVFGLIKANARQMTDVELRRKPKAFYLSGVNQFWKAVRSPTRHR